MVTDNKKTAIPSIYLFFPILPPSYYLTTAPPCCCVPCRCRVGVHVAAGWGRAAAVRGSSPLSSLSSFLIFSPQPLPPPKHKHPYIRYQKEQCRPFAIRGSSIIRLQLEEAAPFVCNRGKKTRHRSSATARKKMHHRSSATGGRRCASVHRRPGEEDAPLLIHNQDASFVCCWFYVVSFWGIISVGFVLVLSCFCSFFFPKTLDYI